MLWNIDDAANIACLNILTKEQKELNVFTLILAGGRYRLNYTSYVLFLISRPPRNEANATTEETD